MSTVLKYLTVYLLSGLKFIFGPALGVIAYELPVVVAIALTASGMMTTIYLFTYFGDYIRAFLKRFQKKEKKLFSKKSRRFVKIWRKFGLKGVCFLTPLLLSPPGGGLIINVLGSNKGLILKWMWISALFWSTVFCVLAKYVSGFRDMIQSVS